MKTPFDAAIGEIKRIGYHNHRLETHSDVVSKGLFEDLVRTCEPLRHDLTRGTVKVWYNVSSPGDRLRKVDLFVGEPSASGDIDIPRVRIAVENKSVITAHRNRTNRFDDLKKVLGAIHAARPEALIVGTVLVGLARRVLNIPDQVHKFYRERDHEFNSVVLPRLSTGDESLWKDYDWAISFNTETDASSTVALLRSLPVRKAGHTHAEGYDALLLVPVYVDNVNAPHLPRPNSLGIDVDAEYKQLLTQMCAAYTARWHM